ncbi:pentapeptide repeat-containing protein [Kiloniella sp.]|uniref:pentapeptide repeat-containing protein n=1 Tax=Kiloniella sp. TaxID=1938587 RepID=UPI003A8EB5E2
MKLNLLEVRPLISNIKVMKKSLCLAILVFTYFQSSSVVLAACTDPAGADVDWQRCNMDGLNLDDVDLSGSHLRGASFLRGSLDQADLNNISAFRVKFVSASLVEADFSKASLPEADFTKANLQSANFTKANLKRARLFKTNLRGANLTKAKIEGADLTKADLSGATWIDGKRICAEGSIGRCK